MFSMLMSVLLLGFVPSPILSSDSTTYTAIADAYLCVASEFIETHWAVEGARRCAMLCSDYLRCQAFRAPDDGAGAPCQLFVFDACSRSVRSDCGCSQRGQVFVKQRPGLPQGSLCPASFGHGRCGVKYRGYNSTGNWWQSKQRCESNGSLVIMANAADIAELNHLNQVRIDSLSSQTSVWIGGLQQPVGSWSWVKCSLPLGSGLWAGSEPNGGAAENATVIYHEHSTGMSDFADISLSVTAVICQCVSPFD